ncbi:MAG: N-acetyl-gamma-glutamyl-phosphate reductase [Eubacterium sp.]|nr:N-acetyl-gamma-glutamyl-phosphate reductase [Eubacterium sp.]
MKKVKKIKAGIIGATGYAGHEVARLLYNHPSAEVIWYGSRSYVDQSYSKIYGNMKSFADDSCRDDDIVALAKEADVIFTATPQGYLAGILTEEILKECKVVDLSADYRLKDVKVYESWYKIEHKSPQFLAEAVYGLAEVNREAVKKARLVANPGCYTTCSILTLYPLVKEHLIDPDTIIVDAKSGTSGAGRGAKVDNLFCEVNENFKAYGVASHRHTPEIEEQLGYAWGDEEARRIPGGKPLTINFTPHLLPINRGILATCYAKLADNVTAADITAAYEKYYAEEPFIRFLGEGACPQTRWVEGSNLLDIGFVQDPRTNRVIAMGALDNMVKGAAGQAVQNMNLMFGLPETEGLLFPPMFP